MNDKVNDQATEYKAPDGPPVTITGGATLGAFVAAGKAEVRHSLPNVLRPLMELRQWVNWRWKWVTRKDGTKKRTKVPYQPNGRNAQTNNPATWSTYEAVVAASRKFDGIGVVVQGFGAFDIDDCLNPETGELHEWARQKVNNVGSYAEVTVSGTGLRIIGLADGSDLQRKIDVADGVSCELYRNTARYIVVTGNSLGTPAPLINIDVPLEQTVIELDAAKEAKPKDKAKKDKAPSLEEVIAHGHYEHWDGHRARAVWYVVCEAIRSGWSDEQIVAALLDPGNVISESVLERADPQAYAEKQVAKGREEVVQRIGSEQYTDLGNAKRLVRRHGEDLRYVYAWQQWMAWRDGHWMMDEDGFIERVAKETVEAMFVEASLINDEDRRKSARAWALKSQEAKLLSAMVRLARSDSAVVITPKMLDADPLLLGVSNGVIDLRTGTFREARREDYITKRAGVAYDPKATCPGFLAFLKMVISDEIARYLARAVGYALTGETGEEIMFILWGTGNNGKSTWRETIFALLGDYAMAADASLLISRKAGEGATPEVARLHGKRLVTVNETPQNALLNEARVKFITSHDKIAARKLYKDQFDFTPSHKVFLTTNHKPIVKESDEGTWRRLHLLPFVEAIPEEKREANFRERVLIPELPGILNWALAGLAEYRRIGLDPPEEVKAATEEYQRDMDIIGRWIEERCARDNGARVENAKLYADYEGWAQNEIGFALSAIAFGRELSARGLERVKVDGSRGVRGLRLLNARPQTPRF